MMWASMSAECTPDTDLTGCVFKALTPSGSCPIAWVAAPSACARARPGFDAACGHMAIKMFDDMSCSDRHDATMVSSRQTHSKQQTRPT